MNFEENLKMLEDISKKLEDPNLGMDEGVRLYENGINVAKECYKALSEVKGKITILKEDIDKYREENFE